MKPQIKLNIRQRRSLRTHIVKEYGISLYGLSLVEYATKDFNNVFIEKYLTKVKFTAMTMWYILNSN